MRTYELMTVVQPNLDEEGLAAFATRVQQVITDNGGQVVKAEQMGRRRLAYPIKKRTEGHYVLFQASLERPAIVELERMLTMSDDVLRHMMFRLDELA